MSKKVNYGAVNNRKSGVKNRFFKYVLCLCLGVVSLFGFMPKNSINVKAEDSSITLVSGSKIQISSNDNTRDYVQSLGSYEFECSYKVRLNSVNDYNYLVENKPDICITFLE